MGRRAGGVVAMRPEISAAGGVVAGDLHVLQAGDFIIERLENFAGDVTSDPPAAFAVEVVGARDEMIAADFVVVIIFSDGLSVLGIDHEARILVAFLLPHLHQLAAEFRRNHIGDEQDGRLLENMVCLLYTSRCV